MISLEYRTNRARFPEAELEKYRGQWVAFSPDGTRIVASGETPDQVEKQLKADAWKPSEVVLHRVPGPDEDVYFGSEEFR